MEIKKCSKCQLEKSIEEFNKKTKNRLSSFCKECNSIYLKEHYRNNKKYYIDKRKKWQDNHRDWFNDLKKDLKCKKCGENRWWVLDFHHKEPNKKELELARMLGQGKSKESILYEISKCDVLCSNCHRDLHHQENVLKKHLEE